MVKVLIAIQARSTSTRLPNKAFELIGRKPLLQHVISACNKAAQYTNNFATANGVFVDVALVIPEGDRIGQVFNKATSIIEGPEHDVLSRYFKAYEKTRPDYIVRITGDCPLIPPYLITKHIKTAQINSYDYLSNVDEKLRTSLDGWDCEVISGRALEWLNKTATDPKDREHVTTLIRKQHPAWAKIGHVISYVDLSGLKLSVDTQEDLERVRAQYEKLQASAETAANIYGPNCVHRL